MHFNLHDSPWHFLKKRGGLGKTDLQNTGENEVLVCYLNRSKQEVKASFIDTPLPTGSHQQAAQAGRKQPHHMTSPNALVAIFT